MATASELETKILAFLADELEDVDGPVTADTALFSDGLIDSFAMAGLIEFVEELAGTPIAQSDVTLENFDTVARIVDFLGAQAN